MKKYYSASIGTTNRINSGGWIKIYDVCYQFVAEGYFIHLYDNMGEAIGEFILSENKITLKQAKQLAFAKLEEMIDCSIAQLKEKTQRLVELKMKMAFHALSPTVWTTRR